MFGFLGRVREWMNWKVHKVFLVRDVGGHFRVVKTVFLNEGAVEFRVGKKAFPFRPKGVAVELKNVTVHYRDFDSGANLKLNSCDYVITETGQFITPEELDAQNASRDIANVGKGGLVNDWIVVVVFGLVFLALGVFVGMTFGDAILRATGGVLFGLAS